MTGHDLQAAAEALEALETEALVGMYGKGFVFEDTAAGHVIGTRKELRSYFDALFAMTDTKFSEVAFFESGTRGAGTWVWSGTNQNGGAFTIKGASIFELAEDGIHRETIFYDPRPALS